jgi:hypothetical protein
MMSVFPQYIKIVMKKRPQLINSRDKFDILSAAWVLACNDPISIMTYKGIKYRLNLPNNYDLESLVEERGELFRPKVPLRRLNEWRIEMQSHISKRPAWIRDLENDTLQLKAIKELTVDDIFRSQFRTEKDAPPSSLEIIDWGLQHIERLRKGNLEAREEVIKRWQLWSVIILSITNILVTVIVALLKK